MRLSNANGHPGAQGNQSPPGGRTHGGVTRLLMLIAVVLSASHGEAHVGYTRTLILRSIPIAAALRVNGSDAVFLVVIVALLALGTWASQITGRDLGWRREQPRERWARCYTEFLPPAHRP